MPSPYTPSVVLCSTTGTGVQNPILDIGGMGVSGMPPVIQVIISATATVKVYGALDISTGSPPQLVNSLDVSNGGFTASDFYDLIPGIRFYQINITANSGNVTVKAGAAPGASVATIMPHLVTQSTDNSAL